MFSHFQRQRNTVFSLHAEMGSRSIYGLVVTCSLAQRGVAHVRDLQQRVGASRPGAVLQPGWALASPAPGPRPLEVAVAARHPAGQALLGLPRAAGGSLPFAASAHVPCSRHVISHYRTPRCLPPFSITSGLAVGMSACPRSRTGERACRPRAVSPSSDPSFGFRRSRHLRAHRCPGRCFQGGHQGCGC